MLANPAMTRSLEVPVESPISEKGRCAGGMVANQSYSRLWSLEISGWQKHPQVERMVQLSSAEQKVLYSVSLESLFFRFIYNLYQTSQNKPMEGLSCFPQFCEQVTELRSRIVGDPICCLELMQNARGLNVALASEVKWILCGCQFPGNARHELHFKAPSWYLHSSQVGADERKPHTWCRTWQRNKIAFILG